MFQMKRTWLIIQGKPSYGTGLGLVMLALNLWHEMREHWGGQEGVWVCVCGCAVGPGRR